MTAAREPYYEDDLVTLWHGDCREVTAWLEADVLVTDPPYGIGWPRRFGAYGSTGEVWVRDSIAGDEDATVRDDALKAWGKRPAIIFGSWRIQRPANVRALLIWHKKGSNPGPLNAAFMTNHEEVYVIGDAQWRKSSPPLRSVITTTESRTHATAIAEHPTPKPVGLMEALVDRCPPGVIADPFAGTGATLLAAKQLGRKVVGVEVDERYCEIAAKRLAQDTLFGGAA